MMNPLITTADLDAFNVAYPDAQTARVAIEAASAAIRDAAGAPITQTLSTIRIATEASRRIELPARRVVQVHEVRLDNQPVTDWRLIGTHLWREEPWQQPSETPSVLQVTFSHGFAETPGDIVALCCSLAAAGINAMAEGYDPQRGISYERLGDYQYGMATGDGELVDPFQLPEPTRQALRKRFGSKKSQVSGSAR